MPGRPRRWAILSSALSRFPPSPDEDVVRVRRMIASAFVDQLTAGTRQAVPAGALAYPV